MHRLGETISEVKDLKAMQETMLLNMSQIQNRLQACYEDLKASGETDKTTAFIRLGGGQHSAQEVEERVNNPDKSARSLVSVSHISTEIHAQIRQDIQQAQAFVAWEVVFEKLPNNKYTRFLQEYVSWWTQLSEPARSGLLNNIITHALFRNVSMSIILLNAFFASIIASQQMYAALGMLDYNYDRQRRQHVTERIFAAIYAVELTLRLANHRLYFFINTDALWNIFDFLLVVASGYEIAIEIATSGTATSLSFMRVGRMLKLTRILRILRSVRFLNQLKLMLSSCTKSFSILFWCVVVLCFLWWALTLALMQALEPHIEDGIEEWKHEFIVEHFSTLPAGMLLFLQLGTGGIEWADVYKVVSVAGRPYQILFLLYIVFYAFGLFNILTGVVVENVMDESNKDDEAMDVQYRLQKKQQLALLTKLFSTIDSNSDGFLEEDEYYRAMSSTGTLSLLHMAGIDTDAAELFFRMLRRVDEKVTVDVFLDCCLNMRGQAKAVDMQLLLCEVQGLRKKLSRVLDMTAIAQHTERSNAMKLTEIERKLCVNASDKSLRL